MWIVKDDRQVSSPCCRQFSHSKAVTFATWKPASLVNPGHHCGTLGIGPDNTIEGCFLRAIAISRGSSSMSPEARQSATRLRQDLIMSSCSWSPRVGTDVLYPPINAGYWPYRYGSLGEWFDWWILPRRTAKKIDLPVPTLSEMCREWPKVR